MAAALFLDRDGVINEEKAGGYILHKGEFRFCQGAEEAIAIMSRYFDYLLIVTNQRGVGRGLMTEAALHEIHEHLCLAVEAAGGRIDRIYFAPSAERGHVYRKPNTGMAHDALADFPDIEFGRSVMVGNNLSDMQFGRTMGMKTVFLHTTQAALPMPHPLVDQQYSSLQAFARAYDRIHKPV